MGKQHTVYTGVVIKYQDKITKFTETTKVQFGRANREQIQAYVDTGEPLYVLQHFFTHKFQRQNAKVALFSDKAGGYGIQGIGGTLVERIDGDYFTVMGLPVYRLSIEICKLLGYKIV